MIKIVSLFFAITVVVFSCHGSAIKSGSLTEPDSIDAAVVPDEVHKFRYDLDQPDETFELINELEEISGLGISPEGSFLYAVQDENGIIFKLSKATGEVVDKIKFHKDGDYEGIEVVDDQVYVVKSTGTLYQVSKLGELEQQMKKFNGFLSRENDVEGLAYDKKNNRLLYACKGIPATGESFEVIRYKKVIYAFDIATNTLLPDPIYTIQLESIRKYLEQHTSLKEYEKLLAFFSKNKENLTFNPSAIAVHPLTGNIFVISSSGKVLLVLDEKGEVSHIEKLKKAVHAQPEGIVFDEDGTLYISNEGKKGKPNIHKFNYGR